MDQASDEEIERSAAEVTAEFLDDLVYFFINRTYEELENIYDDVVYRGIIPRFAYVSRDTFIHIRSMYLGGPAPVMGQWNGFTGIRFHNSLIIHTDLIQDNRIIFTTDINRYA